MGIKVSGYQDLGGYAKMGDMAERIRRDYRNGLSTRDLAKKYRMSLRDIGKILKDEGYTVVSKKELNELRKKAELLDELITALKIKRRDEAEAKRRIKKFNSKIQEFIRD